MFKVEHDWNPYFPSPLTLNIISIINIFGQWLQQSRQQESRPDQYIAYTITHVYVNCQTAMHAWKQSIPHFQRKNCDKRNSIVVVSFSYF